MEVLLKQNTTDDEMIDIVTMTPYGREILWGVVHCDLIKGEDMAIEEILRANKKVEVIMSAKV